MWRVLFVHIIWVSIMSSSSSHIRHVQVALLKALGAEHVLNSTDPSFRADFGALCKAMSATLAFDAVGADTTKALMLGMPAGSRVCVYGALGGGPVAVPSAGQMLGLKHGSTCEVGRWVPVRVTKQTDKAGRDMIGYAWRLHTNTPVRVQLWL